MVQGNRARTKGLNAVGLQRQGWSEERIKHLEKTIAKYFRMGTVNHADMNEDVQMMLDFAKESKRGIALPVGASSPSNSSKI
jgi:acyl-[acyl carrier protein]--UDP-N-acetylglucosamine O-acyltransferase